MPYKQLELFLDYSPKIPCVMPRINGKSFRCECGCNVFTVLEKKSPSYLKFKCNNEHCNAEYEGE